MFKLCVSRLVRDECGASIIEFAAISPVLCLLLLGMVDFGLAFSEKMKLEQAAARAIEMATGRDKADDNYAWLAAETAAAAGVASSAVTVTHWLECDGVRQAAVGGNCTTAGAQIARYVQVVVDKRFVPPFDFSAFAKQFGGSGLAPTTLRGDAVVRVQ